ncbi:hypothetical protein [Pyrobaculum aerophilum]|uniref:Uncharacterized protein n=1 Tax=Pyrobaculum aerophilum TaxID=13773 RepID=A0A371QVU4_9CREN|nr:hypothetical protein [Pyrobaculum aerophilum]RFA94280.1 hypothetical protein CGL52_14555 [Pyrobaculum aerophilum]RFA95579.1 hypothetical protein CGL51_07380 [Pyrobaculum aerophilum]
MAGERIYAVGRRLADGFEQWLLVALASWAELVVTSSAPGEALAASSGGEYLYVAGLEMLSDDEWQWRVEKRGPDLTLHGVYTSNPSPSWNSALGLGVNPATGHLWVVGYSENGGVFKWRIEILDRELNRIEVLTPDIEGWANGVVFDHEGNAYVYGSAIAKFDEKGRRVAKAKYAGAKAVYAKEKLYLFGDNALYKLDDRLRLIEAVKLETAFGDGKAAFDGENIYAAGHKTQGERKWVIYSIKPFPAPLPPVI